LTEGEGERVHKEGVQQAEAEEEADSLLSGEPNAGLHLTALRS